MIYEHIDTSVPAVILEPVENAIRKAAVDEWDEVVQHAMIEFANELRARLQHVQQGDIQKQ